MIESRQQRYYEEYGFISSMPAMSGISQPRERSPEEERYDGYIQLENGVGMMRMFINEFQEELEEVLAKEHIRE